MVSRRAATGLALIALAAGTLGQSVRPEFDAASVRPSPSLQAGGTMRIMPDGGIQVQGLPVRHLITIAFGLQPYQLVNAPEWSREARYDVQAKPARPATRTQTMAMLQALVIERFGLMFHRERRQLDGFRLVRANNERLGPNIRPSQIDCEKVAATEPACREARITVDSMKAVGSPLWSLLKEVIAVAGGPVDDATGLAGTYDFELLWSNELAPSDDRPSFFTALQEQLGLRLERRSVTEEVFVVDRLERAGPN